MVSCFHFSNWSHNLLVDVEISLKGFNQRVKKLSKGMNTALT